jgi:hypothetical protein
MLAVDALDLGAEPELDPVLAGVPVEVVDDLVTGREHPSSLGIRPIRQMRERPPVFSFSES